MKFNEKTGEKIPESRKDEFELTMEQLLNLQKQTKGLVSTEFENNIILKDISLSLALIVDMLRELYNRLLFKNGETLPREESEQ